MTPSVLLFWGLAIVFTLAAAAFVLYPIFKRRSEADRHTRQQINIAVYRDQLHELERDHASGLLDQAQFEAAKLELASRLSEDALQQGPDETRRHSGRGLALAVAAILPAAAIGMYLWLGNPQAILQASAPSMSGHDLEAMLQSAEEKARANPNDPRPLLLLARTYAALERWSDAVRAYEQAAKLLPKDATILANYAEAIAFAQGRDLRGRPMEIVQRALSLDPNEPTALHLAALHAFMQGDYPQATAYWQRLLKQLPPESGQAEAIKQALSEAEHRAKTTGMPRTEPIAPSEAGQGIHGRVELDMRLKDRFRPGSTLFVIARPASGGGPPVAVLRTRVDRLPVEFTLDDSLAMDPQQRLSEQSEVTLIARLSVSGQPMGTSGDLEGRLKAIKPGASNVRLVIDSVLP